MHTGSASRPVCATGYNRTGIGIHKALVQCRLMAETRSCGIRARGCSDDVYAALARLPDALEHIALTGLLADADMSIYELGPAWSARARRIAIGGDHETAAAGLPFLACLVGS